MRGFPYAWLAIFVVFMVVLRFAPAWNTEQAVNSTSGSI
jgi:hypothetical protein